MNYSQIEAEVKDGTEMAEAVDPVLGRIGTFGKFQARVSYYTILASFSSSTQIGHIPQFTHIWDSTQLLNMENLHWRLSRSER